MADCEETAEGDGGKDKGPAGQADEITSGRVATLLCCTLAGS